MWCYKIYTTVQKLQSSYWKLITDIVLLNITTNCYVTAKDVLQREKINLNFSNVEQYNTAHINLWNKEIKSAKKYLWSTNPDLLQFWLSILHFAGLHYGS